MPTMEVTTPIARHAAFQRVALLDMRLQISDMPPAFDRQARPIRKPHIAQRLAHGAAAAAVARRVDVGFAERADIGSAAEEMSEMSLLVTPRRDLDGAVDVRIAV